MTDQPKAGPKSDQVARANRMRETIAEIKRGIRPAPKTPRDFTDRAAAEAARKVKAASR